MFKPSEEFRLDHIGIAVQTLEEGAKFYRALGLGNMYVEVVEKEKVKVGMFEMANHARIELLEPTMDDSPVGKFLAKRGPGIHHICFRVPDLKKTLAKLKADGVRLINEEPSQGAHNCLIAFVHPSATGGVLIELSEFQGQGDD